MNTSPAEIIVAGVTVLDLIPTFLENDQASIPLIQNRAFLTPGQLVSCGPARVATGGAAPNTGLALYRLGFPVRLAGRVGDDLFGKIILDSLASRSPELARNMVVSPGETTSYAMVINPPGFDRAFLYCSGANDTFSARDVHFDRLADARLFHFGYLNVMPRMYQDQGKELQSLYRQARSAGLVTSLDIAFPDLNSQSFKEDWPAIFSRVLPEVDIFIPSFNESLVLLDRQTYDQLIEQAGQRKDSLGGILSGVDGGLLTLLGERLVSMGAAVVGLKLGDQGLYLRTTGQRDRLERIAGRLPVDPEQWANRELLTPCFKVKVAGTVGAGDCTIAGFLAGVSFGQAPEAAMTSAVAVGACSVEAADATSGIPGWDEVQARIGRGWARLPMGLALPGWEWDPAAQVWVGPHDASRQG